MVHNSLASDLEALESNSLYGEIRGDEWDDEEAQAKHAASTIELSLFLDYLPEMISRLPRLRRLVLKVPKCWPSRECLQHRESRCNSGKNAGLKINLAMVQKLRNAVSQIFENPRNDLGT